MRTLNDGWIFARTGGDLWTPIESLPTTVHVELLKTKQIPDPVRLPFLVLFCVIPAHAGISHCIVHRSQRMGCSVWAKLPHGEDTRSLTRISTHGK